MSDLLLLRSDNPAETMAMPVASAESLQNSTRNMQLSAMVAAEYANQFLPHLDTNTLSSITQFVADTQTLASQPEKIVDNLFRANELTKSQVRGMVSRRVGSTSKDPGAGDKPVDGSSPSGLDTDTMDTIDAIVDRATGSFVGAFSDRTSQLSETVAATSEHLAAIADKRRGTNIVTRALRWLGSNPVEFERSRKEAEIDK